MKKLLVLLTLTLAVLVPALGSIEGSSSDQNDPVLARIIEIGKTDNQTTVWLDYLANRFGTRISGTDGYTNAAEWALEQFRSWGLKAELQEAGEMPVGFTHGPAHGKVIGTPAKYLFFTTPAFSAGTKGRARGPVVVAPAEPAQIEAMKARLEGAWVFVSDAGDYNRSPKRGEKSPMTKLLEQAGALGAIARSGEMPWRVPSNRVASWDELPTMPDITLLDEQYDEIKASVTGGKAVELEFEIRNHFKKGPVKYHNVIAWLPGTESDQPAVILSGHLDTVPGSVGATDCGSGVTAAMEAIRILAKAGVKPKRTIMTHLFAAEELGILGAQAWLKQHPQVIPNIGVLLNRDYNPAAVVGATVPPSWQADFERITAPLANLNPEFPFELQVSPYPNTPSSRPGGTDASVFSMARVPTLRFAEKTDHVYRSTYHTIWDTFDDALPYARHQEHTAMVLAAVAYGIGNLDHQLSREDFYLPDGIYADIYTAKGRVLAKLDHVNAPEAVKAFVGLFEVPPPPPGTPRPTPTPGAQQTPPPSVGSFLRVDAKSAARAAVTLPDAKGRAVAAMPKERNDALKHDRAGILGMTSPTEFYITTARASSFDKRYPAIGTVVADMKVVSELKKDDAISRVTIIRIGAEAVGFGK